MRMAYQYRLRPTVAQVQDLNHWLDMLRSQYNWLLAERFDWWELNRCSVNACPLTSSITPPKAQPDYYNQKRSLVTLKQERSWYKEIHSQVLQDMVKRVGLAFDRYLKGDSKGKRSGKPRFKGKGRYHSFTYTQADNDWIAPRSKPPWGVGNRVSFPKLGTIKFIQHRPLPEGFDVKTACINKKADGWYITFSLVDESVPTINPDIDVEKAVGIDLGLKDFLVTGNGLHVPIPQYYRKAQKRLAKEQRKLAHKKNIASKRRGKQVRKVASLHAKIARQRKEFHHKTAVLLLRKYEVIAHENLNIKGLARTRLAKSVHDAGWGTFITILANPKGLTACRKAEKAGCLTIGVNPKGLTACRPSGTTPMCSDCDAHVPKTLSDRWHSCPYCGLELDRDENSGRNMLKKAEGAPQEVPLGCHPVFKARRGDRNTEPVKREARTQSAG